MSAPIPPPVLSMLDSSTIALFLQMPVLALGGEVSLKDFPLRQLQAVAKNGCGGVVPRCGHWIPDEHPDYLCEQLLTFFGEEK